MKERGMKGNGTVHVPLQDIFQWLQDREELVYQLPSYGMPYRARATSRFDTPEGTAIFGSVLRYELILQGVGTVFRRQGYEADLKMICQSQTRGMRGSLMQRLSSNQAECSTRRQCCKA